MWWEGSHAGQVTVGFERAGVTALDTRVDLHRSGFRMIPSALGCSTLEGPPPPPCREELSLTFFCVWLTASDWRCVRSYQTNTSLQDTGSCFHRLARLIGQSTGTSNCDPKLCQMSTLLKIYGFCMDFYVC